MTIAALWKKEQIDLAELARLRWVEKWTNERLVRHFDVRTTLIKNLLRQIRANPKLAGLTKKPPTIRGRI